MAEDIKRPGELLKDHKLVQRPIIASETSRRTDRPSYPPQRTNANMIDEFVTGLLVDLSQP